MATEKQIQAAVTKYRKLKAEKDRLYLQVGKAEMKYKFRFYGLNIAVFYGKIWKNMQYSAVLCKKSKSNCIEESIE